MASRFNPGELKAIFSSVQFCHEFEVLTKLLQEVISQFIERSFEELINREGIKTSPGNEMVTEDDKYKMAKMLRQHIYHNIDVGFCIPCPQRKQLVWLAASMCFGPNAVYKYSLCRRPFIQSSIGVNHLQIPGLLVIMLNCALFSVVHEIINEIAHLYIWTPMYETNIKNFKQLASTIGTLITKIDDTMLPDKSSFQDRLKTLERKNCVDSGQNIDIEPSHSPDEMIASIQADLQNPDYINWVKGTLTLKYVSEGAKLFTVMIFEKFKHSLPESGKHFDDGANIKKMCEDGVEWKFNKWKYPTRNIHCYSCQCLFDYVIENHRRLSRKTGFHNCRNKEVGGAWGIAKLFMPENCGNITTPNESDTQALFYLIQNCFLFTKCSLSHTEKITKLRNNLMHSANFTMTNNDLIDLYESTLKFIEEAIEHYCSDDDDVRQNLDCARSNIVEVRESKLEILSLMHRTQEALQYERGDLEKHEDQENDDKQPILERKEQLKEKAECYEHVETLLDLPCVEETKLKHAQVAINTAVSEFHKQVLDGSAQVNQAKKVMQYQRPSHHASDRELEMRQEILQNKLERYENVEKLLINLGEIVQSQKPRVNTTMFELRGQANVLEHRQLEANNVQLKDQGFEGIHKRKINVPEQKSIPNAEICGDKQLEEQKLNLKVGVTAEAKLHVSKEIQVNDSKSEPGVLKEVLRFVVVLVVIVCVFPLLVYVYIN